MDLPVFLESEEFVSGEKELHQTMELLLREERGTFLQNFELGSQITPHVVDRRLLHAAVLAALEPVRGLVIDDIYFVENSMEIVYRYDGVVSNFIFTIDDNK